MQSGWMTQARGARSARRIGAGAAALLLGAGCAQEADDSALVTATEFEASTGFLATVAEQSATTVHRFEMEISMVMSADAMSVDLTAPMGDGEHQGDRTSMVMDMAPMLEEMSRQLGEPVPPEMSALDLTIEMAADGEVMYMRIPGMAAMFDQAGAEDVPAEMGPLLELGDRWGRLDIAAVGESVGMADVQSVFGATQAGDPGIYLDLVAGADEARELGDDRVRGVPVHGLAADITLGDLFEEQGIDPEDYVAQFGGGAAGSPAAVAGALDAFLTGALPVEVWVDDDGYVRRLTIEMDLVEMLAGLDLLDPPQELSVGTSMDFFDYGDESINIEMPDDWVDVTDAFLAVLEMQGGNGDDRPSLS